MEGFCVRTLTSTLQSTTRPRFACAAGLGFTALSDHIKRACHRRHFTDRQSLAWWAHRYQSGGPSLLSSLTRAISGEPSWHFRMSSSIAGTLTAARHACQPKCHVSAWEDDKPWKAASRDRLFLLIYGTMATPSKLLAQCPVIDAKVFQMTRCPCDFSQSEQRPDPVGHTLSPRDTERAIAIESNRRLGHAATASLDVDLGVCL